MPKLFTPTKAADPVIDRIQADLKEAINGSAKNLLLGGRLTDTVAITTSFQNIPHKLGRKPLGWFVVSPDADTRVWEDTVNNPNPKLYIRVVGSAVANLKFWVF